MKNLYVFFFIAIMLFIMGCGDTNQPATSNPDSLIGSNETLTVNDSPSPEIDSLVAIIKKEIKEGQEKHWPSKYLEFTEEYRTRYSFNKKKELVLIVLDGYEWTWAFYLKNGNFLFIELFLSDGEEPYESKIYFTNNKAIEFNNGKANELKTEEIASYEKMLKKAKSELSLARYYPSGEFKPIDFNGKYVWESETKKNGEPASVFNLFLEYSEDMVTGGYDAFIEYGNQSEGQKGSYECKVTGTVFPDMVYLKLTDCTKKEEFSAFLVYSDGKYLFKSTKSDGQKVCPAYAVLTKL
jgi:hypothetical protein